MWWVVKVLPDGIVVGFYQIVPDSNQCMMVKERHKVFPTLEKFQEWYSINKQL